jgi:peptidoglycan/xylan/chitin deacetylase (PgdA/CDA1 family)
MSSSRCRLGVLAALVAVLPVAACQGSTGTPHGSASSAARLERPPSGPDSAPSSRLATTAPASLTPSVSGPAANTAPPIVTTAPPVPTPTVVPLPSVLAAEAGKDVLRLPTNQHVVALTFDAGANADAIPKILATLQAENVPGTFFLTGAWVKAFPGQARQVGALYPVGNHSSTHPHFTQLSSAAVRMQVTDAQTAITAAAGRDPQPLFRFPFGDRDTRTRDVVNSLGYISIFWTVDTLGWEGTSGGQSTSSVVRRVMAKLQPGEIVLMHVGSNPVDHSTLDGDSLKAVIDQIKAAGYGFVTVPQGLGLP